MAGSTTTDGIGRQLRQLNALVPARPARVTLSWQLAITAALAAASGYLAGWHGAISAMLGGGVSILAGIVFLVLTANKKVRSADSVLITALRAEGAKVVTIVVLLWLVLSLYREIVTAAFFAAFALTVIIFSMAFFVREK